ncbi:MAG: HEAT repeat domain-containing protein [Planctomycetota bacterium]
MSGPFGLKFLSRHICADILHFFAASLLGTVPLLAQTPDEARIFLGEGPPAASEAATERLDAAWRRLLVGPRFERTEARREIVAMGPAAARRLISELSGDSGEARRQAALTLGRIDLPEVRAALRRAVTGEKGRRDETLLCHAALALADQGERDAAPELLAQISRVKRPRTRRFLILALARLGEPETARHLVDLADRDRSLEFRATLVLALGLSEGHEADRHLDAAVRPGAIRCDGRPRSR